MADASKLKSMRRQGLGTPPPAEEARVDLAPLPESSPALRQAIPAPTPAPSVTPLQPRIDGRTLRRSGRTVQFATRVSPEFDDRVRQLAMRDGLLLVEVLERALQAYEQLDRR